MLNRHYELEVTNTVTSVTTVKYPNDEETLQEKTGGVTQKLIWLYAAVVKLMTI